MKNKIENKTMPPAIILCGGQGTRLRDVTEMLPKPMVPVGPHPIIWHIMKTYAAFGVKRFILCLGYKREAFIDYFLNYHARATDITISLGKRQQVTYHGVNGEEEWEVTLADTGVKAMTGCRVARVAKYLKTSDENFFLTYGDGVANVNISELYAFHQANNKMMTVTAVHPAGRFGEMKLDESNVMGFHEKPQTEEGFINGGYMVIQKEFIDKYLQDDDDLILEQEPMMNICKRGEMAAFQHKGFWQCMDTAREYNLLNELWNSGKAPWTEAW